MTALSKTNKYLWRYKYHLIFGALFVCIANVFQIVPAQVVRSTFDQVAETIQLYKLHEGTPNQSKIYDVFVKNLVIYGLLIVCMALLRGFFMFLMRQTIIVMSRHIEFDQKNDIYKHYQSLPMSFYRKNNTGDLMARISEDVSKVRMYFGPAIMYGMNLVSTVIIVVPIMFSINAKLTLWALLPLPLLSVTIYYVNTHIERKSLEIQKSLSDLSTSVQEAFSGIRVIKAFAREENLLEKYDAKASDYKEKSMELAKVNALFAPSMMAMVGMSVLIIVFVGGHGVIAGKITAGNIAEFIMYVTMLTWPFTALGWVSSIIQRAEASQKRINEFLDTKSDIFSEKSLKPNLKGNILFKNVTMIYPESGTIALRNISFEVPAGKTLAILGSTGSGKSTIANLICRLMDPTQGAIYIDGINLKDLDLFHLRHQIGYVPQEVFLFSDTIANNIAFGADEIDKQKLLKSAKDADLYDNIESFPDKFETRIGERGITLSGGQKQRVSIARALIREPNILLLDDCLSAVDTKTENTILSKLETIMANKTTIIISHRVSSAKLADYIIYLENGEIVEQGPPDYLYQNSIKYRELFDKQMQAEATFE